MLKSFIFFFSGLLIISCFNNLYSQDENYHSSPYFNFIHQKHFIEYALNSGNLKVAHVLSQPYSSSELYLGMNRNVKFQYMREWFKVLNQDLNKYLSIDSIFTNVRTWNFGASGGFDLKNLNDNGKYRLQLAGFGFYSLPYLVLYSNGKFDQNLKDDPDYYGNTSNFQIGRMEDAYILFKYKAIQLFAGRLSRNLGIFNEPSLVFSDIPYSFDHFGIEINDRLFKYSFYFTRLNDIYGFDIQSEDQNYNWMKRYFYLHRLEVSILKNLEIGLTEFVLNGGENQGFLPYYLNPLNFFRAAEYNQQGKGEDLSSNIFYALEAYWKPVNNLTLYSQFLIDDIDYEKELREKYPDRLGYSAKIILTDFLIPGTQLYSTYNKIDNWTYISFRSWENYTYHEKSIGYPSNSVENFRFGCDYFGYPPFIFSTYYKYERLGEQDWDAAFDYTVKKFPKSIVQQMHNINLNINYIPSSYLNSSLTIDWRSYKNFNHINRKKKDGFSISISLNANIDYKN